MFESIANPGDTIDVNIKGTFNVLELCKGVKNLVLAFSSAGKKYEAGKKYCR
ncbi:MAG: hypothetical protein M3Y53_09410 [Thermoproteota archaeon]|nr:hypothetical protein [Thermoproteota archaeon]